MCGVIGILGQGSVNQMIYDALTVVQHRGQDAAGIMTCDHEKVYLRKDNGLVRDVFHTRHMQQLHGNIGIGHCRYPTAGSSSPAEAQPLYVNSPLGLALAHNGNLTNAAELRDQLFSEDLRHLNTNSDSEILLNVLAHELRSILYGKQPGIEANDIFKAMGNVFQRCHGAYAVVSLIVGGGLLAFRDRHGIRPMVYGRRATTDGWEHMMASESVALDVVGFELVDDVKPGEAIFIDLHGVVHRQICATSTSLSPCIFEYVYLARPDSIIDNVAVHRSRLRMGERLADKIMNQWPDHDIDVVIPIPDTSRTSALQMANAMNVIYREGFIKNRYIGRTFIMPGQAERKKSVRQKLNPIELEFRDKNVLLVDDSIVRGTTSKQIIQMARDSGAKKVYFASAAPPVRYPNVYGIDMPTASELVANGRTEEEVCNEIGADRLFYQSLDDLISSVKEGNPSIQEFDCSCFDAKYITDDVSESYLKELQLQRSDHAKHQAQLELLDMGEINSYSYR